MSTEKELKQFFSSPIVEFMLSKDSTKAVLCDKSMEEKFFSEAFAIVEEDELQILKDKNKSTNTERCTTTWINRLEKWQEFRGINVNLPDISPKEFDSILLRFYAELRTGKGEEYEPVSLRTMLGALHRL